uniref:Sodefrin-like factor n=1 Tax=Cacopsylla melanoneura TaxID=428564 RepID=A0A8D8SCK9_9HEMI
MMAPGNLPLLIMITFILNIQKGSALNWTVADEDAICSLATPGFSVCAAKGPADENCKTLASKVTGSDPQCYEENVCSFTKDGSPAYVTCNSVKPGYEILRNCINGLGIANPNPKVNLGGEFLLSAGF